MSAVEMANKLFKSIEARDLAAAAELLSDDFTFKGPVAEPISGPEWMEMIKGLQVAFPDWRYNATDFHEDNGKVRLTVQITGTHRGELDLSNMGMPNVPATGKSIKLARDEITLTVAGGKFTSLRTPGTEGGGVKGLLSQLGIQVPPPSAS